MFFIVFRDESGSDVLHFDVLDPTGFAKFYHRMIFDILVANIFDFMSPDASYRPASQHQITDV